MVDKRLTSVYYRVCPGLKHIKAIPNVMYYHPV